MIRVHEADAGTEVDILPTTKSGDMLTFKTDRFSTYAIAYAEPNGVVVPTKVTLNKTQVTLTTKGGTTQLTATVEPDNATNKNVTWESSDTGVATVDENGVVTAVGNGTATITVTTEEGDLTATVTITVDIPSDGGDTPEVQKPASISLNKTKDTLTSKGSTTQLIATVKPDNAVNKKVTWKSSDTSVATVDANGLVTAEANGTAVITAATVEGGLTASATITVKIPSDDNGNGGGSSTDDGNGNNSGGSTDSGNGNGSNNADISSAAVPDSQKESQSVTSPKTGDDFNMALWTTLLIASAAGLIALFGRRKKKS